MRVHRSLIKNGVYIYILKKSVYIYIYIYYIYIIYIYNLSRCVLLCKPHE